MKKWLRERMHCKVSKTIKQLNIKLIGHYRYYGITDNTRSIRRFYEITVKMYYKVLNRRSQKNRYGYLKYYENIEKQIVNPKIYVDIIKMNIVIVYGKIVSEIDFKFIYDRYKEESFKGKYNHTSIAKCKIELLNNSIIEIYGYDEIADYM